jgi:nucleotide-binding universal stress UspA family protein
MSNYFLEYKLIKKKIGMKTILVPTDFSKNAENAVDYAIHLAKTENAKIILLNAYYVMYLNPESGLDFMAEQGFTMRENSAEKLKQLSDKIEKTEKIECEFISIEGMTVDSIVEIAEKRNVDFIVMGTQGASGIKKAFMGSNTVKVIGLTSRPLIAVPEKASFNGNKSIVFATDYQRSDMKVLKELAEIAKKLNAKIHIVHVVNGETDFSFEEVTLKNFADKVKTKLKYPLVTYKLLYGNDVEKKLSEYLKKEATDLLGVNTKNRNFFERFFGKSITKKLAYHTAVPLMVFHHN